MDARNRYLRSVVGVVFGLVGLGVAWLLISWSVASLSPTAVHDLFAGQGLIILLVIASLAIMYFFGTAAMWAFDAVIRHSRRASIHTVDTSHNHHP